MTIWPARSLVPGRIASQHAQKIRDLGQVPQSVLDARIVFAAQQVQIKQVLPGFAAQRAGLDLGEIQITQRECAQTAKQSARNVTRGEDHRSLPLLSAPGRRQLLRWIEQEEAR